MRDRRRALRRRSILTTRDLRGTRTRFSATLRTDIFSSRRTFLTTLVSRRALARLRRLGRGLRGRHHRTRALIARATRALTRRRRRQPSKLTLAIAIRRVRRRLTRARRGLHRGAADRNRVHRRLGRSTSGHRRRRALVRRVTRVARRIRS